MRKILAILLSICLLTTAFISFCAAEDSGKSVSSFQLGEFSFEIPDGMEATQIGGQSYIVTIAKGTAWAVMYATDVSDEESASFVETLEALQQKSWADPNAEHHDESETEVSFPGFDVTFTLYETFDGNGAHQYHMVGTFTDTWYVYTYYFTSNDADYSYVRLFTELIKESTHSGKARRFAVQDAAEATAASTEAEKEEVTAGQRNALRSADSYLNFTAFSYTGLIEQLEYAGYTQEEAKYAADNCGADWMEQAAKSAKTYLSFMGFSRSGLIEQLEYAGFTHEQAVYGVEQNGL